MQDIEQRSVTFEEAEFSCEHRDGEPVKLSGYAAVFNSLSRDLGGFRERIIPGAFSRVLAEGADVPLRIEHRGLPLARTSSGTLKLQEDHRGLRFEATLDPNDPDVMGLVPKIRRGDLRHMSFGFKVAKGHDGQGWTKDEAGPIREIRSAGMLIDVAPVTIPAYLGTDLALRSLEAWAAEQGHLSDMSAARMRLALAERTV